ncbi:hypothetical protein T492DRAFT_465663 [Pavlovales sp. CCMP2436]|nr:hypothetical protein T492DRAFT_465663 [Pavlovales sp. CCMP2436]
MRNVIATLATLAASAMAGAGGDFGDEALRRGNQLYVAGDLLGARTAYERCLEFDSGSAFCLSNLASVLLDLSAHSDEGDAAEARRLAERLYRRVIGEHPVDAPGGGVGADAAFNLALLMQDERTPVATAEACALYDAIVRTDTARTDGNPRWDALANLASCTHDLRAQPLRAFELLAAAIMQGEGANDAGDAPVSESVAEALAKLYRGMGTLLAEADSELCAALLRVDSAGPRVLLLGDVGDGGSDWGGGEGGEAGGGGGTDVCELNARNALLRSLELSGDEPQAEHALTVLAARSGAGSSFKSGGEGGGGERANPAFVRALFDDFAPTFNAQLQGGLQYVVPALVGEAVGRLVSAERRGVRFASALDAGCGTGLLGPQLRAHVSGQLAGVDLSPKMVRFAAALPAIYDVLKVGDLLALGNLDSGLSPGYSPGLAQPPSGLAGLPGPFELVAAGDVLVYFGQLEDLLQAFRRVLSPGSKARVVFRYIY